MQSPEETKNWMGRGYQRWVLNTVESTEGEWHIARFVHLSSVNPCSMTFGIPLECVPNELKIFLQLKQTESQNHCSNFWGEVNMSNSRPHFLSYLLLQLRRGRSMREESQSRIGISLRGSCLCNLHWHRRIGLASGDHTQRISWTPPFARSNRKFECTPRNSQPRKEGSYKEEHQFKCPWYVC